MEAGCTAEEGGEGRGLWRVFCLLTAAGEGGWREGAAVILDAYIREHNAPEIVLLAPVNTHGRE